MSSRVPADIVIRQAAPEDAPVCGKICYDAFSTLNAKHGFPCDFPGPEAAIGMMSHMFATAGVYCIVAEQKGRIVGSNAMDERSTIAGIGPISVDPTVQNHGAGKKMMQAVMDRAVARGSAGIRLVQAAFHNRSFALYTGLGFDVREPLCCLQGRTAERQIPECSVRTAEPTDLEAGNALARRVHGFDRSIVVERGGRITGYSSSLSFFGHTTAETNIDLQALIASADSFAGPGILLPSRNSAVLRWCLANGLRIVQPMTLMTAGLYNEPAGAWMPSVLY
jgi:GNAT superfamily N-acetyltransferase